MLKGKDILCLPLTQENRKHVVITHRLEQSLGTEVCRRHLIRGLYQGSLEKQNQYSMRDREQVCVCARVCNIRIYYKELVHTITETDKSQHLQGWYIVPAQRLAVYLLKH